MSMVVDPVSLVQFATTVMLWLVFFIISLSYMRQDNDLYQLTAGIICASSATVMAFTIPYFWIGLTTVAMFATYGLIFMVMGFVSLTLILVFAAMMLMIVTRPSRQQEQILTLR